MAGEAVRAEGTGGSWGAQGSPGRVGRGVFWGGGPLHRRPPPPQVLEQLLVALRPPESGDPRRGSLLVALVAEGEAGRPRCTVTVAAAGELSRDVGAEVLRGAARGVLELPGVPVAPSPCCGRILRRARLRAAFQLSPPPGTLTPDCVALRRFLHRTSLVHPEVEFHFCVSINGAVTSHSYGAGDPRCRLRGAGGGGRPGRGAAPPDPPPLPLPPPRGSLPGVRPRPQPQRRATPPPA
ncbi:type 2 DNA topoisomerase 6 subunit B-like [Phalacrocorax carbo]|uniref:type 2 DNA topoisomerase 6 subunit B-like n=1 Tax=Phalacrocorax carbo TaxID=9209 RepID=UPI0031199421